VTENPGSVTKGSERIGAVHVAHED
jgi:hypothetical protein